MIDKAALYRIGSIAALLQLAVIVTYGIVTVVMGIKPDEIQDIYLLFQADPLAGFLRGDLFLVALVGLYLGTFPPLFTALKSEAPTAALLATAAVMIAAIIGFANESTFSLWHLAGKYADAGSEAEREMLLAAGEAVLASGWWSSTNAYISGFLLQGGGVLISIVMLRSHSFGKLTAITGLAGNALDLMQHLLEPFLPGINQTIAPIMGPFYLVWFPLMSRDLARLKRAAIREQFE